MNNTAHYDSTQRLANQNGDHLHIVLYISLKGTEAKTPSNLIISSNNLKSLLSKRCMHAQSATLEVKDTTPSKLGLHQSRICLSLVRCCPPAWLSPISAEYVANKTPSEVAVSPYLICVKEEKQT